MERILRYILPRASAALASFAAVALFAASLGTAVAQEKSKLDDVLDRGKLVVVTLGTVPPFAFKDDKGELVGFDVDVARLVANALFRDPNKIEFVIVTSDGRWPAIESGRA